MSSRGCLSPLPSRLRPWLGAGQSCGFVVPGVLGWFGKKAVLHLSLPLSVQGSDSSSCWASEGSGQARAAGTTRADRCE